MANQTESISSRRDSIAQLQPSWREETLDVCFSRQAQRYGDRPYLIGDDAQWSYNEVELRSIWLAKGLYSLGVRPGQRVALLMGNYSIVMPLMLAIWRLGAAAVLLNYAYKEHELAYVLEQSKCRFFITMSTYRDNNYLAMLDQIWPEWDKDTTPKGHLEKVITFGISREGVTSVADLMLLGTNSGLTLPINPSGPNDPAVIMYTSGTTGTPKGVIKTHDQELRTSYATALQRACIDGIRVLFSAPPYHAFGFSCGLLTTMWVGGAAILRPRFEVEDFLRHLVRYKATDVLLVPTMAVALLQDSRLSEYQLNTLSTCMLSSATAPEWLWSKLRERLNIKEIVISYGMTELTASVLMTEPDDPDECLKYTAGHIINAGIAGVKEWGGALARLRVVSQLTNEDVRVGELGELYWSTPCSTVGYLDNADATESLYTKDHVWLKSGDLGVLREDGYVSIRGRVKDQYNTGGELVAPQEVEEILNKHTGVAESYVFGIPDDKWGELGAAYVVPQAGATLDEQELQAWCRTRLAKYKWPRHIWICAADRLPKTPSGKVQKRYLIKMAMDALNNQSLI